MKKIIVSLFAFAFLFAGQLMAAPMQAYYCFNTQQPEVIIEAFDENFDALASKGVSTHRLYEFHLNGQYGFTHCIVSENSGPDAFEKTIKTFQGSEEGKALLAKFYSVASDVLNGAGTPLASVGDAVTPVAMLIDIRAKNNKLFVEELSKLMNSSDRQGSISLFEDTFTGVKGRTHYVVIGGSSLDEVLSNFRGTLSSPDGKVFLKKAPKFRKLMNKSLIYLVKTWEAS